MRSTTVLTSTLATALGVAAVAIATVSAAPATSDARSAAATRGADFRHPGSNPWFPLRPGTVWVLRGHDEGHRFTERTLVTHRHRVVDGVRARVVRDVVRRGDGSLAELTHDWYAVDHRGAVWYFGEATATYDRHGDVVSREGSWEAGVDGARAGRIMPAHPRVTDAYRQEMERGVAEDQAWVVQRGARVRTPAVRSHDGLRSLEWSRLEPDVVSQKLYVRGYGQVAEHDLAGGSERFVLVRMHRP